MKVHNALPCLALVAFAMSCAEPAGPADREHQIAGSPCQQVSSISASSDPTPRFSWSPDCQVGEVRVGRLDDNTPGGQIIWIAFDPGNRIDPGIAFGDRFSPAEGLQPNQTYQVSIHLIVGGDAAYRLATANFSR